MVGIAADAVKPVHNSDKTCKKLCKTCISLTDLISVILRVYNIMRQLRFAANHSVPSSRWYQPTEWYQSLAD